ncbi:hypothetical protein Avbf_08185 [Armadillidium vulgare]|nr:hypothetical protein Avbf_08185 [Armadillidium vulgare]
MKNTKCHFKNGTPSLEMYRCNTSCSCCLMDSNLLRLYRMKCSTKILNPNNNKISVFMFSYTCRMVELMARKKGNIFGLIKFKLQFCNCKCNCHLNCNMKIRKGMQLEVKKGRNTRLGLSFVLC